LGSGAQKQRAQYLASKGATEMPAGFAYDSGTNEDFLSVDQIRDLIRSHINPAFEPI
jgi:UDP-N-acetylglucosamine 4,6-dehydratase